MSYTILKHTPGPWKYYSKYYGENAVNITAGSDEKNDTTIIAEVLGSLSLEYNALTRQEAIDNAKLIAAAPELLEALQSIIKTLHAGCINKNDKKAIEAAPEYQAAVAAIKKATE